MITIEIRKLDPRHIFPTIIKPLVEWAFKIFGWLAVSVTLQVASERSGRIILFYASLAFSLLVLSFLHGFFMWITDAILGPTVYRWRYGKQMPPLPSSGPLGALIKFVLFLVALAVLLGLWTFAQTVIYELLEALKDSQAKQP